MASVFLLIESRANFNVFFTKISCISIVINKILSTAQKDLSLKRVNYKNYYNIFIDENGT